MVSHISYNLYVYDDFVIFFASKFIICFIDDFPLGMKSQSIVYYYKKVDIYATFYPFKVKCIECVVCGQMAFKNARAILFCIN